MEIDKIRDRTNWKQYGNSLGLWLIWASEWGLLTSQVCLLFVHNQLDAYFEGARLPESFFSGDVAIGYHEPKLAAFWKRLQKKERRCASSVEAELDKIKCLSTWVKPLIIFPSGRIRTWFLFPSADSHWQRTCSTPTQTNRLDLVWLKIFFFYLVPFELPKFFLSPLPVMKWTFDVTRTTASITISV
jgi:hypothetical protein